MFSWLFRHQKEVEAPANDYEEYAKEYLATTVQFRYIELKNNYHAKLEVERTCGVFATLKGGVFTYVRGLRLFEFPVGKVLDTETETAITYEELGRKVWK